MDGKTFLMQPADETAVSSAPPRLDYRDFQRSIALISSFRSGSHMLKLSLGQLASMSTPVEPFNHNVDGGEGYTVKTYLAEGGPKPSIMTEGHGAVHHFLARFYKSMPPRRSIILDIKYSQAYIFGVNASMRVPVAVPVVLEELHKLQIPFIHLTRRDLVAQAISLLVAEDEGAYLVKADEADQSRRPVRLSPRDVMTAATQLRNARDNARAVMDALGVRSLEVGYEDLISPNWRYHYREILRFVNRYADIPETYSAPTRRQDSASRVTNLAEIRDYVAERDRTLNG